MNDNSAIHKLYELEKIGIKLGLENSFNLANYLGNPHNHLKCIHIAGTNGKGSTSSFIASILQENNYKVGLYTSPHLIRFNERIKINGIEIEDSYIEDFVSKYYNYIKNNRFTFFEATTMLAFQYFKDNNVDYAVIETGLGGRLDSTNIIDPLCSVITNIDFDHKEFLGDTIEKIAYEKAGIIKKNKPVFCGILQNEAENVMIAKASENSSQIYFVKDYVKFENNYFYFIDNPDIKYYNGLDGIYQVRNSALATLVIKEMFNNIDNNTIQKGLFNVIQNTNLSGRFEYYHRSPDVIFDCAHNPNGVKAFVETFQQIYNKYDERILIFGAMKDKDIDEMLNILDNYFDKIYFCDIEYDRSEKKETLKNKFANNKKFIILNEPNKFIANFIQNNTNKVLVVLGSIYILGNIKKGLLYAT